MDPRVKELAKILTDYSIKIKKNDRIRLTFDEAAKDLGLECYKNIIKKGAYPVMHISLPGFAYEFYKNASEEQLKHYPKLTEYEVKKCQGLISIGGETNTKELSNIDPKKIAMRRLATSKISDYIVDQNNWCIFEYPTAALAQDAEMSVEEFKDFVFTATNIDWEKESKKQDNLKNILDKGKDVRIVGENTDIRFSIKGRQGIKCDGHRNMPDGEVFIAPCEKTTKGYIQYDFPVIRNGKEVTNVRLKFENGKVIEAHADKNEDLLLEMINLDKGSSYLGEFGIGLNYNIQKFVKQILFDEKIGGTIHLALGRAYNEGGGRNKSALHWDMIKDLRKKGAIYIDGKCIQKNGKWLIDL